jgi:hypothetical protein
MRVTGGLNKADIIVQEVVVWQVYKKHVNMPFPKSRKRQLACWDCSRGGRWREWASNEVVREVGA